MLWPPRATQLPFKTCHGFGCEGENAVLRERRGLGDGALLQGAPSGALPGHGDAEEEMLKTVSAFAAQSPAHACAGAMLQGKDVLPQSPAPLWDLQPHTMSCRKAHKALAAPWSCSPGSASMRGQPDHGECVLGSEGSQQDCLLSGQLATPSWRSTPICCLFWHRGNCYPSQEPACRSPQASTGQTLPWEKREKKSFRKEDKNGDFCLGLILASRQASLPGGRL